MIMRRSTIFTSALVTLATVLASPAVGSAAPTGDPPIVVVGGSGNAFDFGVKGNASDPNAGGGSGADQATWTAPRCVSEPMGSDSTVPVANPGSAVVIQLVYFRWKCTSPDGSVTYSPQVSQAAVGAVAPPPNPADVAAEAYNSIRFPTPTPHLSPDSKIAVAYWNYLWTGDPGTLTASATAAGLTVTASATLASSTWSMGEVKDPETTAKVTAFTCRGGGEKPGADPEWNMSRPASTDCAYAYRWRSLGERTSGEGTWPVTVSTTWNISWTASSGVSGTATRTQVSAPLQVYVGEWRTIIVADGEGGG